MLLDGMPVSMGANVMLELFRSMDHFSFMTFVLLSTNDLTRLIIHD